MLRRKAAFSWTLLLALLAAAGGWMGMDVPRATAGVAGEISFSTKSKGDSKEYVSTIWKHGCEALHPTGQSAPAAAKSAGAGGDGPGVGIRMAAGPLPLTYVPHVLHSQAAMKQRLCLLLTRTEWQQRSALYPKHGFW